MEKFGVFVPRLLTRREFFAEGHRSCQGCGEALAVRLACKAVGRNVIITSATGCLEIISSPYPQTA